MSTRRSIHRTVLGCLVMVMLMHQQSASAQENAGYGRGFFIRSADGNNELRIGAVFQPRYIHTSLSEERPQGSEEIDHWGFQLRRIQFDLQGFAVSPSWTYRFRLDSANGGGLAAAWAWVGYRTPGGTTIRIGQLKPAFLLEETIGSPSQVVIERSYTADYFTTDFSQGIQISHRPADRLTLTTTVHDGSYSAGSSYSSDLNDFAVTGRADLLLVAADAAEGWGQFGEFQHWAAEQPAVLLGVAVNYESGTSEPTVHPDALKWTADLTVKAQGLSLFASGTGQSFSSGEPLEPGVPRGVDGAMQIGFVGQASYFLKEDALDAYVRYESIEFDGVYYRLSQGSIQSGSRNLSESQLSIIVAGLNHYFQRSNLKFSVDITRALDAVPVANVGNGLLRSDGGETSLRTQLQFRF